MSSGGSFHARSRRGTPSAAPVRLVDLAGPDRLVLLDELGVAAYTPGALLPPGPVPPPSDVSGAGFSCCAHCAYAHPVDRCEGCPRPRPLDYGERIAALPRSSHAPWRPWYRRMLARLARQTRPPEEAP
jgi:hypothetical protein